MEEAEPRDRLGRERAAHGLDRVAPPDDAAHRPDRTFHRVGENRVQQDELPPVRDGSARVTLTTYAVWAAAGIAAA